MKAWKSVDEYIAAAPQDVQPKLREVRAAITDVAPDAGESISYGMAFYNYKGETGYKGRFCYFGLQKAHIGLYIPPPIIEDHMDELAGYKTTKSALHLPLDRPIPISLIKRLVRDRLKRHEAGELSSHQRGRKYEPVKSLRK
ncbi:MAG TPA: DUF1801 domain-containing protein [Nitrososphaerales archaeon]|nr:DUF1801 domain-containing protein [Nitrososphaerales archaeon]